MKRSFLRNKWFIIAVVVIILIPVFTLLALRIHFQEQEDAVLTYFSGQEGMPETFSKLEELTLQGDVILCWWDYGRAVQTWSNRDVIEAYPSRDIWHTVGASRNLWYNLAAQIFGKWGSSERIHDLSRIFMLPEAQALPIMKKYDVSYAVVFMPDELEKFSWIADIGEYNSTDYLTVQDGEYEPTDLGSQITLLRLLFDESLTPQHFTKLFDNQRGKIYRVDY